MVKVVRAKAKLQKIKNNKQINKQKRKKGNIKRHG